MVSFSLPEISEVYWWLAADLWGVIIQNTPQHGPATEAGPCWSGPTKRSQRLVDGKSWFLRATNPKENQMSKRKRRHLSAEFKARVARDAMAKFFFSGNLTVVRKESTNFVHWTNHSRGGFPNFLPLRRASGNFNLICSESESRSARAIFSEKSEHDVFSWFLLASWSTSGFRWHHLVLRFAELIESWRRWS